MNRTINHIYPFFLHSDATPQNQTPKKHNDNVWNWLCFYSNNLISWFNTCSHSPSITKYCTEAFGATFEVVDVEFHCNLIFRQLLLLPPLESQRLSKCCFLKHSPDKLCTSITCMIFSVVETLKGLSNCTCSPPFQLIANHNFPKTSGHGLHKMFPLIQLNHIYKAPLFIIIIPFVKGS
jgi:hypothetical protein